MYDTHCIIGSNLHSPCNDCTTEYDPQPIDATIAEIFGAIGYGNDHVVW